MQEKTLFETIEEIKDFFAVCYGNAALDGKAREKYFKYLETLDEVKRLIKAKE